MGSRRRSLLLGAGLALLLLAALCAARQAAKRGNAIAVGELDLSAAADGSYIGAYEIPPVSVRVKVTVAARQITGIEILEHANGLGASAEAVVEKVLENQSLAVDAVSGATVSSKCILKAIENAVKGAA